MAAWDRRHGITSVRRMTERVRREANKAAMQLSQTRPTTVAGAGALVAYARADIEAFSEPGDWALTALASAADALQAAP